MAPTLLPRVYCDYYGNCYNKTWHDWGRWVALGLILFAAFIFFFLISCITARRRRRRGQQPYFGTGWTAGRPPAGHGPVQYTQNPAAQPYYGNYNYGQNQYQAPPPSYQPTQGYFGGQQSGVELQQPQTAYYNQRGGEPVYSPPPVPPPNKPNDGVIR